MSDRVAGTSGDVPDEESFLARWSRRKAEARDEPAVPDAAPADASATPHSTTHEAVAADAAAAGEPRSEDPPATIALPDLDQLDQDADYSAFLAPGVDADLRRQALRKLFHSPKFNVFDGLDTYRDDYRSFPALGEVVTADMRHHLERLARQLADATEPPAQGSPTSPSAAPAAALTSSDSAGSVEPTRPVTSPQDDDDARDPA